jgi:hypothetical protein
MASVFAPGARVQIRDAEWIVKRVDRTSTGGLSLLVMGVSEIVRGKEARYMTEIDKNINVLDPADTALVPDSSAQYRDTRHKLMLSQTSASSLRLPSRNLPSTMRGYT